jgi:hypothetical protein
MRIPSGESSLDRGEAQLHRNILSLGASSIEVEVPGGAKVYKIERVEWR